jgi:hypothetical protein
MLAVKPKAGGGGQWMALHHLLGETTPYQLLAELLRM